MRVSTAWKLVASSSSNWHALFSDDRDFLRRARGSIEERLARLRLRIHPVKSQLFETRSGASFAGFRVLPDRLRVRAGNLRRARRRLRLLRRRYRDGEIGLGKLTECVRSWIAHLEHGDTWRLREGVFAAIAFGRMSWAYLRGAPGSGVNGSKAWERTRLACGACAE
jgi:hypothetical protein